MRGGLERLGANRDALAQMQALSENLKQHRAVQAASVTGQQQGQLTPAGPTTQGPRLPLRPKAQQQKQRAAPSGHIQPHATLALPSDTHAAAPKPSMGFQSHAFGGQENSIQSLPGGMPAHSSDAVSHAAHARGTPDWHPAQLSSLHQPSAERQQAAPEGRVTGSQSNTLAHPGQLVSEMLLGQQRTASDALEQDSEPPLLFPSPASPGRLGE